jgi:hypothetical protein
MYNCTILSILWHADPLPGNDREATNYTTAVAKLRLRKQAYFQENNCIAKKCKCFLCTPCREVIRIKNLFIHIESPPPPCGGGVEYLHRSPASRRRRGKKKSGIWDSNIWSRVARGSDPKMTALARSSGNCKRKPRPRLTSTKRQLSDSNKNLVVSPTRVFYSKTDWPTNRRNSRLRLRIHITYNRVEVRSNTSTAALRVVADEEKETHCLGV